MPSGSPAEQSYEDAQGVTYEIPRTVAQPPTALVYDRVRRVLIPEAEATTPKRRPLAY